MQLTPLLLTVLLAAISLPTTSAAKTVYLIRHGEKPADDGIGLNAAGLQRAQCLRTVFGNTSTYNIGKIMAQTPKSNGKRTRPLLTVQPVATDLGLTVDTSCDRDDPDCVTAAVAAYKGTKNVLICWEHDALTDIAESLGDSSPPTYPDARFDLIWTDLPPYSSVTTLTSEHCAGLDA